MYSLQLNVKSFCSYAIEVRNVYTIIACNRRSLNMRISNVQRQANFMPVFQPLNKK